MDLELPRALLEVGVLPVMVTPIVDPKVGSSMTPAEYPVPPIPELLVVDSLPLEVLDRQADSSSERVPVVPGISSWFRSGGGSSPTSLVL